MQNNLPNELIWALIAAFGGIARFLDKFLREEEKLVAGRIIATVTVTSFTGWMAAEVCLLYYPNWAIIAAGVGGYAGTQIMDELIRILRIRLQGSEQEMKKNDKPDRK